MTSVTSEAAPNGLARHLDSGPVLWLGVLAVAVLCFLLRGEIAWLTKYPSGLTVPLAQGINFVMEWFVENFRPFFKAISWLLGWPMSWLQGLLLWLPWPASITIAALLAHYAGGRWLAGFTVVSLLYMVVIGYWDESMNTLALVGISVPMAVAGGFFIGVAAHKWRRVERIVQPTLDLMQTVPTFAYLIPILLLFGFGPVVGLIASAIYAAPPMVRNTILGLERVPSDILESGQMSGANPRQQFWWVKVPTALPTLMIGVNQTTMAGLSMVIIAAIIGGFADIGWEVLSTMRKALFGNSLLAGLVIALLAMVLDRISRGFTDRSRLLHGTGGSQWQRHWRWWIALGAVVVFALLGQAFPALQSWPDAWVWYPAEPINNAVTYLVSTYPHITEAIKRTALFYFLLPLRIGLEKAVSPFSWGFALTTEMIVIYWALILGGAALLFHKVSWPAALTAVLLGGVFYFGVSGIPWPVFILVVSLLAWRLGGNLVGLLSLLGLVFILVTGFWAPAMRSVYLCAAAVLICFTLGGAVGIWAASSDRVSTVVRPINDTLQTMPLFVFLIPILMFFEVGEFTALLAIVAYAIVPAIRYTEHGLRRVSPEVIEAARSVGCTPRQILWQVKLPLAVPEIMLGLNQTIMFALAMLVIAALVGTQGLGQQVYIALGKGDMGKGVVAGLGIAIIAMIADRIVQSWAASRKAALVVT